MVVNPGADQRLGMLCSCCYKTLTSDPPVAARSSSATAAAAARASSSASPAPTTFSACLLCTTCLICIILDADGHQSSYSWFERTYIGLTCRRSQQSGISSAASRNSGKTCGDFK